MAFEDLRMVPADGGVVEHDLARRMPPHHHPLSEQFDQLPRTTALDDLQYCHEIES